MSSNTKVYEDKMKSSVEHLGRELGAVRAGRANPAVLDKVSVDYYGAPTPIQQVASVAVAEARTLTITPWDRTLLRPISKAIMASDVGITPIDDGSTIIVIPCTFSPVLSFSNSSFKIVTVLLSIPILLSNFYRFHPSNISVFLVFLL